VKRLLLATVITLSLSIFTGCMTTYYEPVEPVDPYPYSFTDPTKPPYPTTLAGAERFISDARDLWVGVPNSCVYPPEYSATYFRGDCDDFATMIACYLQGYWQYDTTIVMIDIQGEGRHAVCFVYPNDGIVSSPGCTFPVINDHGDEYWPVDFTACPGWMWADYGGGAEFTPPMTTYNVVTGQPFPIKDRGGFLEWYEMVNLALDETPGKDSGIVPIPAVRTNDDTGRAPCGGPCFPPGDN